MGLREAAELAIEALQSSGSVFNGEGDTCGGCAWCYAPSYRPCEPHCDKDRAVKALRAALAEDAMQRLTDVQQEMEPTSQESRQVEPVAYVIGYSKGRFIIEAVEPAWLLPVGMALYRSPQRTPLTNQEIMREYAALWRFLQSEDHVLAQDILKFARAIERAHGIGDEE